MAKVVMPLEYKQPSWFRRHPIISVILFIILMLIIILAIMQIFPVTVDDTSVSDPAAGYEEATARITAIQDEQQASGVINPVCSSIVMDHGQETENVIVFFHGFTSCPEQFRELGQQMFDEGYNVYIPLMPHHGHLDRNGENLLPTTAEELAAFATESIDIAQGLGDRLVVGGLSGGGTIAAWIAQVHPDVDRAIAVAPFLGIGFIPTPLNRIVARILDDIPNIEMWWDPTTKAGNPNTAEYAYPGYPLHALAEYLRLGFATYDLAANQPPAVPSIVVINNAHDDSVNNGITNQLVAMWKLHGDESLRTYEFEDLLGLPHDVITPNRVDGDPAIVYPVIVDSIESQ